MRFRKLHSRFFPGLLNSKGLYKRIIQIEPYRNIVCFFTQKLPEKQRQVFILRYYDEMPYEQMSEVLGTSVGALKASYHLAQEKVRASVGREIFNGSD